MECVLLTNWKAPLLAYIEESLEFPEPCMLQGQLIWSGIYVKLSFSIKWRLTVEKSKFELLAFTWSSTTIHVKIFKDFIEKPRHVYSVIPRNA